MCKQIQEKAGRQFQDDMTVAKASQKRSDRIAGDEPSQKQYLLKKLVWIV